MMHGFSTVDGFAEITECLAEMIKYVANEPSIGLFYVQQHTQNAVPNVVSLRNSVVEKSWESNLQNQDTEDSITITSSMKECGFPIADEMVKDIKKSLSLMSTKQPRRGLIKKPSSSFHVGRTISWGTATWGYYNGGYDEEDDNDRRISYFSNVFKTAKEKASNFKWPQLDLKDSIVGQTQNLSSSCNPSHSVASEGTINNTLVPDLEADDLSLSGQIGDELEVNPSSHIIMSLSDNFEDFKADKEAKLEEWLGDNGDRVDDLQESK